MGLAADAELDEILRGGAVLVARSSLCLAAGVGVVRKVLAAPDITILSQGGWFNVETLALRSQVLRRGKRCWSAGETRKEVLRQVWTAKYGAPVKIE